MWRQELWKAHVPAPLSGEVGPARVRGTTWSAWRCRCSIGHPSSAHIENIDSTLIAEEPRVMKHAPAMKAQIAAALGIQPDAVGIKATTNEAMGFIGRREGIAAMAVASVGMG